MRQFVYLDHSKPFLPIAMNADSSPWRHNHIDEIRREKLHEYFVNFLQKTLARLVLSTFLNAIL